MTVTIEQSTDNDLEAILRWLKKEYIAEGRTRGFYCNRDLIRKGHHKGEITVLREDDVCVAFHLHGDIMEVRPDKRGKGYGRALAEDWIRNMIAKGAAYLEIECAPSTSLGFWNKMGFRKLPSNNGKAYARRILHQTFELPQGEDVDVKISFFREEALYRKGIRPTAVHRPRAVKHGDQIRLAERVIGMKSVPFEDVAVKIQVDDKTLYFEKAKYPEAKALGIRRYRGAFYCDCLSATDSSGELPRLETTV
jgi:GNAT superfamily N-acetyltransferase